MLNSEFYYQFIFYTIVLPQNVVDDASVKQHDVHIFSVLCMKTSSRLIFYALRLKLISVYVDWTALRSIDSLSDIFVMNFITFMSLKK